MRYWSILFALLIVGCNQDSTHRSELELNASPVVGAVGMRSAKVWCQLASGNQLAKPYVFLLDSEGQRMVATPMASTHLGDCFQIKRIWVSGRESNAANDMALDGSLICMLKSEAVTGQQEQLVLTLAPHAIRRILHEVLA